MAGRHALTGHYAKRSRRQSGRSRSPRSSACPNRHSRSTGAASPAPSWGKQTGSRTCAGRSSSRSSRAWDARPPSSTATSPASSRCLRGSTGRTLDRAEKRSTSASGAASPSSRCRMRAASLSLLAELGQTEQALAELGPIADRIQATGDMAFTDWRGEQLRLLAERGTPNDAPDPDELVAAARADRPDASDRAGARGRRPAAPRTRRATARAGTAARARSAHRRSRRPLPPTAAPFPAARRARSRRRAARRAARHRFEPITAVPSTSTYSPRPAPSSPKPPATTSAAARLYTEAAERWREFGNVPERAYALLGQGRCLAALGQPEAEEPLREAQGAFARWATSPRSRRRRRCSPRPPRPLRRSCQPDDGQRGEHDEQRTGGT